MQTSSLTTNELLSNIIYPRLSASTIFSDLKNIRSGKQGRVLVADCPVCGKEAHFYCYEHSIVGYCHSGRCSVSKNGKGIDWWAHTKERYGLTRNGDVIKKLAELAGVDLPSYSKNPRKADAPTTVSDVRKLILSIGQKAAMHMPTDIKTYLEDRGMDEETVRKSGLMFVERKPMFDALRHMDVSKELISQSGILTKGFGEIYQVLLPYHDENGECIGFVGRLNPGLQSTVDTPKYKNSWGTSKDVPFLFSSANKPGIHKLIIVEGPIDAHQILHKCHLKDTGVVSLCGDSISDKALALINGSSFPIVVLALDDDIAGHMSSMTLLRSLKKRVFVVNNYYGYKDPGELIAAKGATRFKECLMGVLPSSQWLFKKVFNELRGTGMGVRLDRLSEIAPMYNNLPSTEGKAEFIREAQRATLLHPDTVKAVVGAA